MKNANKSKIFMIVGICILGISMLGSTVAYFRKILFNDLTVDTITHGLDYYITYNSGQDIDTATLNTSSTYSESSVNSTITFYKNDNTYDIYGHIYLNVNDIGTALSSSPALKYALVNNNSVIAEGSLEGVSSGTSVLIKKNIPLQTTEQLYTIYIWLDESEELDSEIEGETLSLTVRCEATMKEYDGPENGSNAVDYITNLYTNYSNKRRVSNNSIDYYYADIYYKDTDDTTSGGLMNDRLGGIETLSSNIGNIRYYGANPNNYVDIGDKYTSAITVNGVAKKAGDPILYRIIGVFKDVELSDGSKQDLIKVVRKDPIGSYSWDTSSSSVNGGNGVNEWSQADLMKLLNPDYENNTDLDSEGNSILVNNSLYYNSGNGTCYNDYNNSTTSCDFTNIGLLSKVHSKIETVKWNLGAVDSYHEFPDALYEYERGTGVNQEPEDGITRTTVWPGKIALMYMSDLAYATNFFVCINQQFANYQNYSVCYDNDWLLLHNNNNDHTLLSPLTWYANQVWFSGPNGYIDYWNYTSNNKMAYPTFYLANDLKIVGGLGLESDPYIMR